MRSKNAGFKNLTSYLLAGRLGLVIGLAIGLWQPQLTYGATVVEPNYDPAIVYQRAWGSAGVLRHQFSRPLGLIVNHHLLASGLMARSFATASSPLIRRVILISPDHFLAGRQVISTSSSSWQTPFGIINSDTIGVRALIDQTGVDDLPGALASEHGIFNLLPMIQRYFPQATVIPIIIKYEVSELRLDRLREFLKREADSQTVVIGSFDFAHGQTWIESERRDAESLSAIRSFDARAITLQHIDSPNGLGLILDVMRYRHSRWFQYVGHDNSARITQSPHAKQTTSYITGVFR